MLVLEQLQVFLVGLGDAGNVLHLEYDRLGERVVRAFWVAPLKVWRGEIKG